MVQINFAQKSVNAKIVYYGPGMSGKTTNLEVVHQRAPSENRGELTSISTDGDRTLFFDYMPLDLGTVAGMRTAFQLYTVPGQVYYNSTRKLVLQGVDGVIFVADSSASNMDANLESLRNLEENLAEYGKSLATLPHVIQYNKRDLPDALPVEELNARLNAHNAPTFEAVAATGQGVFPTLKALAACVLKNLMSEAQANAPQPASALPARAAQAAAPVPVARAAPAHAAPAAAHASAAPAASSAGSTLNMASSGPQRMPPGGATPGLSQTGYYRNQQRQAGAGAPAARPAAGGAPAPAPRAPAQVHAPAPTRASRAQAAAAQAASAAPAAGKQNFKLGVLVAVAAAVGVGVTLAVLKLF